MKCEKCGKDVYVIYINDWGRICPECEDTRREMEYTEDKGWDHDDLDCPEYGEIIVLEEKNYGKKEEMDIHRRETLDR